MLAGARDPSKLERFAWSGTVTPVELDVLDADSVDAALARDVDAVVYLVHGMDGDDFRARDREAATLLRDAVDAHGVGRVVYVSGIIPPIDEAELSEHLASRLEVERILTDSTATVVTLRAAMVLGAASTSFELMAQLAQRLPVTVVPDWMRTDVEPIAVVDLVAAVAGALEADTGSGHFDVAGGEAMPYPELIDRFGELTGAPRPQVGVPLLPEPVVARLASWIADVPSPTVVALMESLREDMVAAERRWIGALVPADHRPLGVDEALRRALDRDAAPGDPMALAPGDPEWAVAVPEADEAGEPSPEPA